MIIEFKMSSYSKILSNLQFFLTRESIVSDE